MMWRSGRSLSPLTLGRTAGVLFILMLILGAVALAGISVGSVGVPLTHIVSAVIGGEGATTVERTIVLDVRLPRVLLAILVGAGL